MRISFLLKLGFISGAVGVLAVTLIASGALDEKVGPFIGGFEDGQIRLTEWQLDDAGDCSFEPVAKPGNPEQKALKIISPSKGRCEVLPWVGNTVLGRLVREPFGKERWYSFSVYLPDNWEINPENEVIAQWHGSKDVFFFEKGGRGPPLALRIVGDQWRVTFGWDEDLVSKDGAKAYRIATEQPITPGRWTDWLFQVNWSYQAGHGLTRVWMNGDKVVDRSGPNAYNDFRGVYLKLGSYHPGVGRTLYLDDIGVADRRSELPIRIESLSLSE